MAIPKAETVVLENKVLIVEALALLSASRGRSLAKVINPVIVKELQSEIDRIGVVRAAINTL